MEVEGCGAVNKNKRAEEKCESVIADAPKCRGQKRPCLEDKELDGQTRQPENRDHRANRPGEGSSRGEFVRSKKGQGPEGDYHQDDESAVHPEETAEKRMERREIPAPIEQARC